VQPRGGVWLIPATRALAEGAEPAAAQGRRGTERERQRRRTERARQREVESAEEAADIRRMATEAEEAEARRDEQAVSAVEAAAEMPAPRGPPVQAGPVVVGPVVAGPGGPAVVGPAVAGPAAAGPVMMGPSFPTQTLSAASNDVDLSAGSGTSLTMSRAASKPKAKPAKRAAGFAADVEEVGRLAASSPAANASRTSSERGSARR
jgi:hypothetical protein